MCRGVCLVWDGILSVEDRHQGKRQCHICCVWTDVVQGLPAHCRVAGLSVTHCCCQGLFGCCAQRPPLCCREVLERFCGGLWPAEELRTLCMEPAQQVRT